MGALILDGQTVLPPASTPSVVTTRGDMIRGGVGGVAERLGLGAAGEVLTSDGTDVAWAAPAGGSTPTTPDLSGATITSATGCSGVGGSGTFVATIGNGITDGYCRCALAWPLSPSRTWELTCKVAFTTAGALSRWVDLGVRYGDGTTLIVQTAANGGGFTRNRATSSLGGFDMGTTPVWMRLRVDGGRVTTWIARAADGPWICNADSVSLYGTSDPGLTSLYLAANSSGVAGAEYTISVSDVTHTDLDPRPEL